MLGQHPTDRLDTPKHSRYSSTKLTSVSVADFTSQRKVTRSARNLSLLIVDVCREVLTPKLALLAEPSTPSALAPTLTCHPLGPPAGNIPYRRNRRRPAGHERSNKTDQRGTKVAFMTDEHNSSGEGLSRIYTRAGDDGTTMLGDRSRTHKTDSRLMAYANCEEASAAIGVALALGGGLPEHIINLLGRIQNTLFDVGADLCCPMREQTQPPPLRIDETYVSFVEQACDHYNQGLPTLRSFVLPGGTVAAALLHQARTIVRRTERSTWAALEEHGHTVVNPMTARYLNRLSDLLFILGRAANAEHGDMLWQPGLAANAAREEAREGEGSS